MILATSITNEHMVLPKKSSADVTVQYAFIVIPYFDKGCICL